MVEPGFELKSFLLQSPCAWPQSSFLGTQMVIEKGKASASFKLLHFYPQSLKFKAKLEETIYQAEHALCHVFAKIINVVRE